MFYHFISCCQLIGLNIHPHIYIIIYIYILGLNIHPHIINIYISNYIIIVAYLIYIMIILLRSYMSPTTDTIIGPDAEYTVHTNFTPRMRPSFVISFQGTKPINYPCIIINTKPYYYERR